MRKVVRLTESDLVRIVKRVINEETTDLIGKTISGDINPTGNRPGSASVKITKKSGNGYSGVITKWNFGSDWGVKIGSEVTLQNVSDSGKCRITIPGSKIKNITLEDCNVK